MGLQYNPPISGVMGPYLQLAAISNDPPCLPRAAISNDVCRALPGPQGKKAEREAAEIHRLEAAKRAALRHRKEREMEEQAKVVPRFLLLFCL